MQQNIKFYVFSLLTLKIYYARAVALRNVFWRYFEILKFKRKSPDFKKIQKNHIMFLKTKAVGFRKTKTHTTKNPLIGDFLFKLAFQFLEHLHININARRKIHVCECFDNLCRRVKNINYSLVNPHLELLSRILIDE